VQDFGATTGRVTSPFTLPRATAGDVFPAPKTGVIGRACNGMDSVATTKQLRAMFDPAVSSSAFRR